MPIQLYYLLINNKKPYFMSSPVYLVNMPYASLTHPSLALGLIETYIKEYGHAVDVIYGNLEFANIIGLAEYDVIDNSFFEQLIGEWTFARAAFPEHMISNNLNTGNTLNNPTNFHSDEAFFSLFSDITQEQITQLKRVRDYADTYITTLAKRIVQSGCKIVACTSTFQQNCASLALLRMVKEQQPSIITIMGGANCESVMGQTISEQFSWIDYVFSGECDNVIGEFIDKLIKDKPISIHNLPHGFIAQGHSDVLVTTSADAKKPPRGYIEDMSQVKSPSYDQYFSTVSTLNLSKKITTGLLAETSRGCWWGAKKHCTFCGLNGVSMEHRCKPADIVIEEFKQLSTKHNITKFEVVDNILPMEYMKTLLPELSKNTPYNIFYETKSNLKKSHVQQLADAGIRWIQPGFESLHDDFLKLIDKGVTGIQNVSALKWCRNYGISVIWNLLCGAPNEKLSWYNEMAEIMPLIMHLQPPNKDLITIRFPRFSPYFKNPSKYGLTLEPLKSYQYIYPVSQEALANIAYFFDHRSSNQQNVFSINSKIQFNEKAHNTLQSQLDQWLNLWINGPMPMLYMSDQGKQIIIIDTRPIATNFTHQLSGINALVYRLCAEPITFARLQHKLNERHSSNSSNDAQTLAFNEQQLRESVDYLVSQQLLLSLSNCYLALALAGETLPLPNYKDSPAGYLDTSD